MTGDGAFLIFGGPYSNIQATQAILAEAARRQIPSERVVCTGDVIAYGADAKACVQLVRDAGIEVVMGNCEEQLAADADDCGCGFAPGSACDQLSVSWFNHARATLGPGERAWMASLPKRLDISIAGLRLAVVHGSLAEISRFVFASTPARVKALDLVLSGADGLIGGHCGLPFSQIIDGRLWHNPGVVGMPANDGTPRVWYSVLTPGSEQRSISVEHACLNYRHEDAATAMRDAGLPEGYAQALSSGFWPSCDVLPKDEAAMQGRPLSPVKLTWRRDDRTDGAAWPLASEPKMIQPQKFHDPATTALGERRATVELSNLKTLWINTGTLCNLSCTTCYIESSPRNDRLVYITAREAADYLDEIERDRLATVEIGFTGGEPFMNAELPAMLEDALSRGFKALVLTNAMKPMQQKKRQLLALKDRHGPAMTIRVSLDHYTQALHELERGPQSWRPTLEGLLWLMKHGFSIAVAGRLYSGESESIVRGGYARLFAEHAIELDAFDPIALVLFPEMDETVDIPEITEACWGLLYKSPAEVMCSSSRMVVKRKGAARPAVVACTLLPYDPQFELGSTLRESARPVALNHPHCAKFCVLGGASCSTT